MHSPPTSGLSSALWPSQCLQSSPCTLGKHSKSAMARQRIHWQIEQGGNRRHTICFAHALLFVNTLLMLLSAAFVNTQIIDAGAHRHPSAGREKLLQCHS
jgi:hypothetical protein